MPALADLLKKYGQPGPRYTSYPTAPHFHEHFGNHEWQEELTRSQHAARGLSLYFHIPFCKSLCFYCGCNMVATGDYGKVGPYLHSLESEMDAVASRVDRARRVEQLHWGGGTPTYLEPEDIRRLMHAIRARFEFAPGAEQAVEADPRRLTREHLHALREAGFNRISFGVQDLDPLVQKAINRVQPQALVEQVFGWAREAGFDSINIDLVNGLPHQSAQSLAPTLEAVIALAPERLAVFGYAHVPWMKKHQRLIDEADLPDASQRLAQAALIDARLSEAGYVNIGLDHYAKPADELVHAQRSKTLWRNFQGYTTHRDCDIYGFGASSISQTQNAYVQNEKNVARYQQGVAAQGLCVERGLLLGREDQLRRDAIMRVMCRLELDGADFSEQWGVDCWTHFAMEQRDLMPLAEDGLVELDAQVLRVTDLGRRFLRPIAMCFDHYLRQPCQAPRYSRAL